MQPQNPQTPQVVAAQPPIPPQQPAVLQAEPQLTKTANNGPSNKGRWIKGLIILFVVFTIFSLGVGGVAAAIAYEKVSFNNPAIERPLTHFVMGLPFTPKTSRYVLGSAANAHATISKHAFDVSLAAKSDDFASSFGLNTIDVEAKGDVDYSDPNNLKLNLNASITKDFNIDIKKPDSTVYFKVNKFPSFILKFLRVDEAKIKPVLENWIAYDTTPLETEARKELDERSPQKSITKEYITNLIEDLSDEKLLSNLEMKKEDLDGKSVYKLHLVADENTINNLVYRVQNRIEGKDQNDLRLNDGESKPSDTIKDLVIDLWVGESDYFVRKVVTSFVLKPNYEAYNSSQSTSRVLGASTFDVLGLESSLFPVQASESSIVMAVKFDKFGSDFLVDKPEKSMSPEDFYMKLVESSGLYDDLGGPGELTARSKDAARLTDMATIQSAINVSVQESTTPTVLCEGDADKKSPCSGSSLGNNRASDGTGWVKVNLKEQKSVSVPTLPVDPVNNSFYHYVYCATDKSWEMNLVLESEQQNSKMEADGGDDPKKYEVGSDLTLIGNTAGCKY